MVSNPLAAIATTSRAFAGGVMVSGWLGYGYWFMRGAPSDPAA